MRLPLFDVRSWKTLRQQEQRPQEVIAEASDRQGQSKDTLQRISSVAESVVAAPILAVSNAVPSAALTARAPGRQVTPAVLSITQAMTMEGLRRWAHEQGLGHQEAQQRNQVAERILASQGIQQADIDTLLSDTSKSTLRIPRTTLLKWRLTGLDVKGDLRLKNLHALTSLPEGLEVRGACRIKNCSNLPSLPKGFLVAGDLTVSGCEQLTQLHADLRVGGALTLSHCSAFVAMPQSLKNVKYLRLKAGVGMTAFPDNFIAGGNVELIGCANLTHLGDNFKTHGGLSIKNCAAMSQLPQNLYVGQSLYLEVGNAITQVPGGTRVRGDLEVAGDSSITQLGEHLRVDGDIRIIGSASFRHLPNDLTLGGDLSVSGCAHVTSLPLSLLSLSSRSNGGTRFIDVRGTGVHLETVLRMREQADGIIFMFAGLKYSQAHTLQLLLNHFGLQPCAPHIKAWPAPQQETLQRYLGRARKTADYKHTAVRPALFERLRLMMQAACRDENFRDRALDLLEDAMQSCGDRVIQGLGQVELALALKQATSGDLSASRIALQALGMQFFKLGIVHAHAAASCLAMRAPDAVEVYLAYETQLRKRLNLPGSTVYTLYGSGVVPRDIEAAALEAEAQSQSAPAVAAFFAGWSPWQRQLRREQAQAVPYEQLPRRPQALIAGHEDLMCLLTQMPACELTDAVYAGVGEQISAYSFARLMPWWLEHGTDPATRNPLRLEDVWRQA